jgi:hypothetical protein
MMCRLGAKGAILPTAAAAGIDDGAKPHAMAEMILAHGSGSLKQIRQTFPGQLGQEAQLGVAE